MQLGLCGLRVSAMNYLLELPKNSRTQEMGLCFRVVQAWLTSTLSNATYKLRGRGYFYFNSQPVCYLKGKEENDTPCFSPGIPHDVNEIGDAETFGIWSRAI